MVVLYGRKRMLKAMNNWKAAISGKVKNFLFFWKNHRRLPLKNNRIKVVLFGTPEYGNLGDHLIAFSELKMLEQLYGEGRVLEVTENDIRFRWHQIKHLLKQEMIIALQGGGNVSDVWRDQEKIRSKILKNIQNEKVILMPQTVYIKDKTNYRILDKYRNRVLFCAREKYTYSALKERNIKPSILCPDIALNLWDYCEQYRAEHSRNGIGVCFRNDAESASLLQEGRVIEYLKANGLDFFTFSTVQNKFLPSDCREEKVQAFLAYLSSMELVVTDRLHAMIGAFLVGTPCIALSNSNKKLEGSYEWIKPADNIFFASDLDTAVGKIEEFKGKKNLHDFDSKEKFKCLFPIFTEEDSGN